MIPSGSQTIGPFFHFGLTSDAGLGVLAREGVTGDRIRLEFCVLDGEGVPTPGDAFIELWQADSRGSYTHSGQSHFRGFGRLETALDGVCVFETIKPGRVPGPDGRLQAPHINVVIFARGLLKHLFTRMYFAGEASNAEDFVLSLVPEARRGTLLAHQVPEQPNTWRMNIRLQGGDETVFFDL